MRKKRNPQCSMELHYVPHETCSQLSGISQWLDAHPQFNDWIYEDLSSGYKQNTGRNGLSAESVLRAARPLKIRALRRDALWLLTAQSPNRISNLLATVIF
ncbi:hypothetical protein J7438_24920 [Thalassotalea sp. G20_0]|uniref:hypothetical protein n=1 Tax=Thalassotalea sp. G20_0 TaxID=2821093 RepID=UPI001ADD36BB|nr:hypothetical protein [Thalassotalea sp. G20_0]MBO9497301.1 hypothetical protein [Thalassotalea sp. G20_0]